MLTLVAAAVAWAAGFACWGRPVAALLGTVAILFGYALLLAVEFVTLSCVQRTEVAARPRAAQLLRAWLGEAISAPQVFLWRQPFRANAEPDNLAAPRGVQPGVVLVHGFVCNRAFWNPWMRELRARHVPFVAVDLEPVFGSIDHYLPLIDAAVARIEGLTGTPVVLVGHSMGGLAIRAWMAFANADERVRRVITIGTPHRGTWLARFGHTINGRQMRLRSPWLAQLAACEPATRYARFTCFFGHCDNIVFPAATGTLPGADNIHVASTAHVHMAFRPTVLDEVLRWVSSDVQSSAASGITVESVLRSARRPPG